MNGSIVSLKPAARRRIHMSNVTRFAQMETNSACMCDELGTNRELNVSLFINASSGWCVTIISLLFHDRWMWMHGRSRETRSTSHKHCSASPHKNLCHCVNLWGNVHTRPSSSVIHEEWNSSAYIQRYGFSRTLHNIVLFVYVSRVGSLKMKGWCWCSAIFPPCPWKLCEMGQWSICQIGTHAEQYALSLAVCVS